jgi:hypothetical protein
MTEQQRPDEDVEGHRRHFFEDPEGVSAEAAEDDVEGHRRRFHLDPDETSDDDVEGHSNVARRPL